MRLKTVFVAAVALLVVMGTAWAGGDQEGAGEGVTEPVTLRLAHVYAPDTVWDRGSHVAADRVRELTDGLINIEVFPASQLGSEEAITEGVIFGSIDMVLSGAGQIGNLFKPILIAEMPYTFRDLDHVSLFAESEIGQEMFADLENEFNIKVIGPTSFGVRHVLSVDKPVRTPEDLDGFTLRVPEQQVTIAYGRAMGANPTPIAYAEAYMALQQGVADGLENPLSAFEGMRFYEVASYVNLTSHVTNLLFFLMNGPVFEQLNAEQQEAIMEGFAEGSQYIIDGLKAEDARLLDFFQEEGLEIIEPDVEAFQEATAQMPVEFSHWWIRYGEDLHSRIQNLE
ncbi:MAG: DctP family TRAP transporter solute-binding subunit [Spirochaetaceae bacterium]